MRFCAIRPRTVTVDDLDDLDDLDDVGAIRAIRASSKIHAAF